jgi:hypothetical protein
MRRWLWWVTLVLVVVGAIFLAVGIVYYVVPAGSIPSFIPGHLAGVTAHRTRRGLALVILGAVVLFAGIAAGVGAYRQGGRWR